MAMQKQYPINIPNGDPGGRLTVNTELDLSKEIFLELCIKQNSNLIFVPPKVKNPPYPNKINIVDAKVMAIFNIGI